MSLIASSSIEEQHELKVYCTVLFDLKFKMENYHYIKNKYKNHANKQVDIISDIMLYSCEHIDIIERNSKTVQETDNFLTECAGLAKRLSDILNDLSLYEIDISIPQNIKTVNNARHSIIIIKNTIKEYLFSKMQIIKDKLNDDILHIVASYLL